MATLKYHEATVQQVRPGVERRLAYSDHLMMAVLDFYDGPQTQPDPPHAHSHEQVSYVAAGEIFFIMDGQQTRLGPGDMFTAPPDRPHSIQLLTEHVRLIDCFTPLREDFLGA
jgi:quercetin dioxygenase-like cupin family protein